MLNSIENFSSFAPSAVRIYENEHFSLDEDFLQNEIIPLKIVNFFLIVILNYVERGENLESLNKISFHILIFSKSL